MTTLRRALSRLVKGEPIHVLAALLCVALLLAGGPAAMAASSHGGGGGHSGGGGHGTAHPSGGGGHFGPGFHGGFRGGFGPGFRGRGFIGRGFGFPAFGFGLGLGLGFAYWDSPYGWWGPGYGYYSPWGPYYNNYYYPNYYGYGNDDGYGYGDGGGYGNDNAPPSNPNGQYGPNGQNAPPPNGQGGPNGAYGPNGGPNAPNNAQGGQGYGPQSRREPMGAVDIDVSPSDAQVYLNGEYIGHVRDFGGWSHGYLWLERGTYDIVFYKDGFKTLARQVSIYPGLVITWDDKMEPGQAVRPEDLATKTHVRRDARIQFERDRAEQIDRSQAYGGNPPPADNGDGGGWNTSWRGSQPAPGTMQPAVVSDSGNAGTADRYGRLHLRIEPADASVYLDGRFVGTGADLAGRQAGLVLSPGHHKLAVVRPGRRAEERDFDAQLGQQVNLEVSLTAGQ